MGHLVPQLVLDAIECLRKAKTIASIDKKDVPDNGNVVENSRIYDVAMLPLFYMWETCCYRDISELHIEKHLTKPYKRFLQDPQFHIWEFYLFFKIGVLKPIPKGVKDKVLMLYELFLLKNHMIVTGNPK